jgi:cbb3-type cytochrome oxidase maturation protein
MPECFYRASFERFPLKACGNDDAKGFEFMSIIVLLIGCSFIVALFFLAAFLWSVKTGQYEDKYTPSVRILLDEEKNEKVTKV